MKIVLPLLPVLRADGEGHRAVRRTPDAAVLAKHLHGTAQHALRQIVTYHLIAGFAHRTFVSSPDNIPHGGVSCTVKAKADKELLKGRIQVSVFLRHICEKLPCCIVYNQVVVAQVQLPET